jgi:hypothetical protein
VPARQSRSPEEVKGHKLLITSREVIFKGNRFQTSLIDAVSTVTHQTSMNGVPVQRYI